MQIQGSWVRMVLVVQWLFRVAVVLVCPETSPPGPKTTLLLASLGRWQLLYTFEIGVFVQPWAAGQWEEKCKQPGFSSGCWRHLPTKPEDLESERHREGVLCSGWLQISLLGDCPKAWKLVWRSVETTLLIESGFFLERPSAMTLSEPSMCLALSVTLFRWHHVRILYIRAQSSTDCVPPCFFIYKTTEVLSEAVRTWLFFQPVLKNCRVRKTAFISSRLMCRCLLKKTRDLVWILDLSECPNLHLRCL